MAEKQVFAKTAKIGPIRTKQSDVGSLVKGDEDGNDTESKVSVLISHVAVSLIRHLKSCHPSEYEVQNVLTHTVKAYTDDVRLEYMTFAEALEIDHSWEGLLTWWNHRDHGTERTHTMRTSGNSRLQGQREGDENCANI